MKVKKCMVPDCVKPLRDPILHIFPRIDHKRYLEWVMACGNKAALEVTKENKYKRLEIFMCRRHFAGMYLMNNNLLSRNAVPSLHLPEPLSITDLANHPNTRPLVAVFYPEECQNDPESTEEVPGNEIENPNPTETENNNTEEEETEKVTTVRSVQLLTPFGTTDLCRICLKSALNTTVTTISIITKLKTLFPNFNFDLYPNPKVCLKCATILNQTSDFYTKMIESDKILDQYVSTSLPDGGPLDIIIIPPDLKEEDAIQLLQKRHDSLKVTTPDGVTTNHSEAPPIEYPINEHCYSRKPRPSQARLTRPIESVSTILDSEGVPLDDLRKKVRKWRQPDRWGKPPYLCEHCGKVYTVLKTYQNHLAVHRLRVSKYICDICGLTLTNVNPYQHSLKHKTKNHKCKLCWKSFLSAQGLKNHNDREHPEGVITMVQCEICGVAVKNFTLKQHCRMTHPVELKHECTVCSKKFLMRCHLAKHLLTHEDKSLECEYCHRKMKHPLNLKKHIEIYHFKTGVHTCHICNKSFWNKLKLANHIRVIHTEPRRESKCDICDKTFRYRRNLISHKSAKHADQFLCGLCHMQLPNILQLRKHYKTGHPGLEFIEEIS